MRRRSVFSSSFKTACQSARTASVGSQEFSIPKIRMNFQIIYASGGGYSLLESLGIKSSSNFGSVFRMCQKSLKVLAESWLQSFQ